MRPSKPFLVCAAVMLLPASIGRAAEPESFSADRAFEHLRILADDIGPRKTGTDGARRAIEYIGDRLRALGLEPRLLPVGEVSLQPGVTAVSDTVNVEAIIPGRRPGSILLGAHYDSRNRAVPGALDDASGAAVILELARVLVAEPPAHTVRLVWFGAEEDGCLGSRHYADHQPIDDLRLVITLDPVGRGRIFVAPFPTAPELGWVRTLDRLSRRHGFADRVLTDPLYALAPRFLSVPHLADHAAFLDRNIPAFNLSSEFDLWEYHTDQDRIDRVQPATMAAAGRAVLAFLAEEEAGRLVRIDDPHYLVLRFPGVRWFLSAGMLHRASMAVLIVAVIMAAAFRRIESGWWAAPRCAAAVAVMVAMSLSGGFAVEWVAERITGWRFPWYARQEISLALAAVATGCTTWFAVRLYRRIQPVVERRPYLAAAGLLLGGATTGFLLLGLPEIAFLFVPPLAALVIGVAIGAAGPRVVLILIGHLHLVGLVAPAGYRNALRFAGLELPAAIGFAAVGLLILPLALTLVGLSYHPDLRGARLGRAITHPYLLLAFAVAAAACLAVWSQRRSYEPGARRTIRVRQVIDQDRGAARVTIDSQEYLNRLRVTPPLADPPRPGMRRWETRVAPPPPLLEWSAETITDPDAIRTVAVRVDLAQPAHGLRVRFRAPGGFLVRSGPEPDPDWIEVAMPEWRYVAEIDRLEQQYQLWPRVPESPITVEVEARYETDLLGWRIEADQGVVYHRNRVVASRMLPGRVMDFVDP